MPSYWLVKCEPSAYSIDDMKREGVTAWDGVRNYQARNFLIEMKKGDEVLFYHSNDESIGIAGIVTVLSEAEPDPSQFDKKSVYFDEAATKDKPRWFCPKVKFKERFKVVLPLADLKEEKKLKEMSLLQKGSRLSVHKLTSDQFHHIVSLARK